MESIYSRLRSWRWELARSLGVPSFFILSNAHLAGVAAVVPATMEELAECPGVGPKKLALFGTGLLELIARCVAEGLPPGVDMPEPAATPHPPAALTDQDLADIAALLRRDTARRLARQCKGRFTSAQVEEALRRLSFSA